MRLFSYVVARDFGFAPNPFYGFCTLACCKPKIRAAAEVGDWVAGTGPMKKCIGYQLVYAMEISEILSFVEYWNDPRFLLKRPDFNSSLKRAYGDNIYHRDSETASWIQEDSHHSLEMGEPNTLNLDRDTSSTDQVLISKRFAYWGGQGPVVPAELQNFNGQSLFIRTSSHKSRFTGAYVQRFIEWFHSLEEQGVCNRPDDWNLTL